MATLQDWMAAQQRLQQSGLPQDTALSVPLSPYQRFVQGVGGQWQKNLEGLPIVGPLFTPPQTGPVPQEGVQAVPFGSLSDPVSQAAFLLAPGMQRGLTAAGRNAQEALLYGRGGTSLRDVGQYRLGERGNLGPPPVSASGEPLPESVVRTPEGALQRLYHGTNTVYPDFDLNKMNPNDWARGVFMTTDPQVAEGYSIAHWPDEAKDAWRSLKHLQDLRAYHEGQATQARSLDSALESMHTAETYRSMEAQAAGRLHREMSQSPWLYRDPAHLRPVYADLKQPFDLDAVVPTDDAVKLLKQVGMAPDELHEMLTTAGMDPQAGIKGKDLYTLLADEHPQGTAGANTVLTNQGYDGLTHAAAGVTYGKPHQVYLAFSPEQVYPSFNVDALRQLQTGGTQ